MINDKNRSQFLPRMHALCGSSGQWERDRAGAPKSKEWRLWTHGLYFYTIYYRLQWAHYVRIESEWLQTICTLETLTMIQSASTKQSVLASSNHRIRFFLRPEFGERVKFMKEIIVLQRVVVHWILCFQSLTDIVQFNTTLTSRDRAHRDTLLASGPSNPWWRSS